MATRFRCRVGHARGAVHPHDDTPNCVKEKEENMEVPMRRFPLVVLIFVLMASSAYAKDYEVKGNAGNYVIDVKFDKNPPTKGENRIEIGISDAALKPLRDATVIVNYFMPSLSDKPPMMEYRTTAAPEDKKYKAILDLPMAGEWTFVINITHDGRTEAMRFSLVVR